MATVDGLAGVYQLTVIVVRTQFCPLPLSAEAAPTRTWVSSNTELHSLDAWSLEIRVCAQLYVELKYLTPPILSSSNTELRAPEPGYNCLFNYNEGLWGSGLHPILPKYVELKYLSPQIPGNNTLQRRPSRTWESLNMAQ